MTICNELLCRELDRIPSSAGRNAHSDMNYLSGERFRRSFESLDAHDALPIAREIADVWCEGIVSDSVTLAAISRDKRLNMKAERRAMR